MITEIRQAVIDKLLELYPVGYKRYEDNVPQNFKTPSFLLNVTDQTYEKRMDSAFNGLVSFDLQYFSDKDNKDIKSDCLEKQEVLMQGLDIINGFRVLKKDARITDNVLHFTFDVKYSEMQTEQETKMQSMQQNSNVN